MENKKFTREDFKEDVREAVRTVKKPKYKAKQPPKQPAKQPVKKKRGRKSAYDTMTTAELRKVISEKKRQILNKFGFVNGTDPRDRAGMVALCKKLKRRRL